MNTQCTSIPFDFSAADESPLQPYAYASLLAHAIIRDLCAIARRFDWQGLKRAACED